MSEEKEHPKLACQINFTATDNPLNNCFYSFKKAEKEPSEKGVWFPNEKNILTIYIPNLLREDKIIKRELLEFLCFQV